jgi:hypothetical protein
MTTPAETRFLVQCHEEWIKDEGKPAVKFVNEAKFTISLLKGVAVFICGSQLLLVYLAFNGR